MRHALLVAIFALALTAPADAARKPTRGEDAALNRLLSTVQGDNCADALTVSRARPLIADGGRWGLASVYCQFGDPPSGAGTLIFDVWARRSAAKSKDWKVSTSTAGSRVPQCRGEGGVLNAVPLRIVGDLRSQCNVLGSGNRPLPRLELSIFRNALREYDDIGGWLTLSADLGRDYDSFSLYGDPEDPSPPPTLTELTKEFGTPERDGCTATWSRISLQATACADDRVTQLVLSGEWLFVGDTEGDNRGGPSVRVGDHVTLARYLDYRLARLTANGRLVLPAYRLGSSDITPAVITSHARITAIEIGFQPI